MSDTQDARSARDTEACECGRRMPRASDEPCPLCGARSGRRSGAGTARGDATELPERLGADRTAQPRRDLTPPWRATGGVVRRGRSSDAQERQRAGSNERDASSGARRRSPQTRAERPGMRPFACGGGEAALDAERVGSTTSSPSCSGSSTPQGASPLSSSPPLQTTGQDHLSESAMAAALARAERRPTPALQYSGASSTSALPDSPPVDPADAYRNAVSEADVQRQRTRERMLREVQRMQPRYAASLGEEAEIAEGVGGGWGSRAQELRGAGGETPEVGVTPANTPDFMRASETDAHVHAQGDSDEQPAAPAPSPLSPGGEHASPNSSPHEIAPTLVAMVGSAARVPSRSARMG